jgi:hypothetical protein
MLLDILPQTRSMISIHDPSGEGFAFTNFLYMCCLPGHVPTEHAKYKRSFPYLMHTSACPSGSSWQNTCRSWQNTCRCDHTRTHACRQPGTDAPCTHRTKQRAFTHLHAHTQTHTHTHPTHIQTLSVCVSILYPQCVHSRAPHTYMHTEAALTVGHPHAWSCMRGRALPDI